MKKDKSQPTLNLRYFCISGWKSQKNRRVQSYLPLLRAGLLLSRGLFLQPQHIVGIVIQAQIVAQPPINRCQCVVIALSLIHILIFTALCMALGVVLPMAFHMIPNAGSVMLPMHIPVLLCGLVLSLIHI